MEELVNEIKKYILKTLLEKGIDEDYIEYEVDEYIYKENE